jgi:Putative peptidoglycan binding domain
MMRRIAAYLTALVLSAGPAMAEHNAVTCVQEALVAAGFDPGPVDGYPGRRTRVAVIAFSEARGKLDLPALTEENGSVLCRLIGEAEPELQAYWPSAREPVLLTAAPDIRENVQTEIIGMARETLRRFAADFDVRLAMPVRFVVAEGEAEFARMMAENSNSDLRNIEERAEYHCNDVTGVSGVTYGTLIGVCLVPGQELGRGVILAALNNVVTHEIVHSAQRQLTGRPPRNGSFQDFVDHRGPLWLTEGSATMIAEALATPDAYAAGYLRMLEDELSAIGWPDLARRELRPETDRETDQLYSGGTLAVARLLSPEPDELARIFRFYEAIGLGSDWQSAFADQFGQTPTEAYQAFLELDPRAGQPEVKSAPRPGLTRPAHGL